MSLTFRFLLFITVCSFEASYASEDNSLVIRGGKLTVVGEPGSGDQRLLLNNRKLRDSDGFSLSFEQKYIVGNTDVVLMINNSGGTACPVQYFFVSVTPQGNAMLSPEFGTCSDLAQPVQNGLIITVTMPKMTGRGNAKYTYENDTLFENGKAIKNDSLPPEEISKSKEIFGYIKPKDNSTPVPLSATVNNTGSSSNTLVIDGTSVTYKPVPEVQPYAVSFQTESKGYRNIYRLDCQGRTYLWTNNIDLRTNQETTNTAGAEWKMMNENSTITNAVYEAICPQLLGTRPAVSVTAASANPQFELEFWSSVKNSDDLADFQAYLDKYPQGQFQELARRRIDRLREASNSSSPASAMTMGGLTPITKPKLISEPASSTSIEGEYNGEFHGNLTVRHSARPNYYTVWLGVGAGSCGGETLVDNKEGLLEGNRIYFNWQQKQRPCTTVITFGDSSANVSDSCISLQSEENSTCAMMGEYQKSDAT
jgi:hypothetical protein